MITKRVTTFALLVSLILVASGPGITQASATPLPVPALSEGANTPPEHSFVSLPPGVSADWWAAVRENIRRSEHQATIEPSARLPTTPDWTAESDHANAWFGESVATAGDVNGDRYDDVIVGAKMYDSGSTDSGRAYVFYGSADGLSTTPDWIADPPVVTWSGFFGEAVASAGDVNGDGYDDIMIGMPNYDSVTADEGAVFVWYGSNTGLGASYDWMAESGMFFAHFGMTVGSAGDVNGDGCDDIIVGAYRYDYNEVSHAFVWHGSASGLGDYGTPANADWMASAPTYESWIPPEGAGYAFGSQVGTAGDVNGDGYDDIYVGAPSYQHWEEEDEGAVFVWHGSATGLGPNGTLANASWMAEGDQADCYFGGTWGRYGRSIGTAGDVNGDGYDDLLVAADYYDHGEENEGMVFLWYGSESGLGEGVNGRPANAAWAVESNQAFAYLGGALAAADDVDGDGYDDVMIGACYYDVAGTPTLESAGLALLWYGSDTGLGGDGTPAGADWSVEGDQDSAILGAALGTAGDVNGDGSADIIIAAPYYDNPETNEGQAYVYHGEASLETSISVYTDKTSYTAGETMHLGLDMTTASTATAASYRLLILLRTSSSTVPVVNVPGLPLPPGWSYSNPNLLAWTLPGLQPGVYAWIGLLMPEGEAPAVDPAIWVFTAGAASGRRIVPLEKALQQLGEVDLNFGQ